MPTSLPQRVLASIALTLLVVGMSVSVATPAQAVVTSCYDAGCPDPTGWSSARWNAHAGYPSNGGAVNGANCTNYAAWRLMNDGIAENLLRGLGNADDWATRAAAKGYLVDHNPTVGSIAQWNSQHVAYVEQVNGDGTIVISESNVYFGSGPRRWLNHRTVSVAGVSNFIHFGGNPIGASVKPRLITTGDWNSDGFADLLHIDGTSFYMYRGNGVGGFLSGSGTLIGSSWNGFARVLGPGDWNGDGNKDLIAIANDGTLYLYPGNGTGGFLSSTVIGSSWASFKTVVAPGDFSGDGLPDLIALATNGDLYLYPGNGTGGFLASSVIGNGWGAFASLVTPGDWNGDGHVDVLGILPGGDMYLYGGDGAGYWSVIGTQIGSGWTFREVSGSSDFSGDGIPDLFGITTSGALYIYRGNGSGTFLGNSLVSGSGW